MTTVQVWTKEKLNELLENRKNFRGHSFYGVDFTGMDLEKADFRGARCPYCIFNDTNCRFANFEGANLMFTQWKGSDLHRANWTNAQLCDADLRGVKDVFGITMTMECRSWKGMKVDPGFWYGFLFYGLLMEPPSQDAKDKLESFFGPERFATLRNLYATRQI